MAKHRLYDQAVLEVREQASDWEKDALSADVFEWRDALQSVLDEVDAQFAVKREEVADLTFGLDPESREAKSIQHDYSRWQSSARTFQKHVKARAIAVKRMCREQEEGTYISTERLRALLAVADAAEALTDIETHLSEPLLLPFQTLQDAVDDYLDLVPQED